MSAISAAAHRKFVLFSIVVSKSCCRIRRSLEQRLGLGNQPAFWCFVPFDGPTLADKMLYRIAHFKFLSHICKITDSFSCIYIGQSRPVTVVIQVTALASC